MPRRLVCVLHSAIFLDFPDRVHVDLPVFAVPRHHSEESEQLGVVLWKVPFLEEDRRIVNFEIFSYRSVESAEEGLSEELPSRSSSDVHIFDWYFGLSNGLNVSGRFCEVHLAFVYFIRLPRVEEGGRGSVFAEVNARIRMFFGRQVLSTFLPLPHLLELEFP